jgi:hypothetical protein
MNLCSPVDAYPRIILLGTGILYAYKMLNSKYPVCHVRWQFTPTSVENELKIIVEIFTYDVMFLPDRGHMQVKLLDSDSVRC